VNPKGHSFCRGTSRATCATRLTAALATSAAAAAGHQQQQQQADQGVEIRHLVSATAAITSFLWLSNGCCITALSCCCLSITAVAAPAVTARLTLFLLLLQNSVGIQA
jgi:hypothetical protein